LLAAGRSGVAPGGLGTLGDALTRVAEAAGATIRCNAEVSDVQLVRSALGFRRATGVVVGTEEIMVRAVLSTLDAKRSFLSLFDWKGLPQKLVKQAAQFRVRGQSARVLFALDAPPSFSFAREMPDTACGPIHIVPSLEAMSQAHDSWRAGALPEQPHITLLVPSLSDPRLAPPGKAVMTATLGAIPAHLFDGPWTPDKRALLVKAALAAAETAAPGVSGSVLANQVIVAPDIEAVLGLSDGDLDGGELTPDQALSFRPWPGMAGGHTAVSGFYLAGPSAAPSPFLTGASGQRAALTLLADLKDRRLP
jgi:phytoene dehydrogenase-like protein